MCLSWLHILTNLLSCYLDSITERFQRKSKFYHVAAMWSVLYNKVNEKAVKPDLR